MLAGERGDLKEREGFVAFSHGTTRSVFPLLSQAVLIPVLATGLETLDTLVGTSSPSRSLTLRCFLKVGSVCGNVNPLAGLRNDFARLSSY